MATWYRTGKEGIEYSRQMDAQAKMRAESRGPLRFWTAKDSSKKLLFLDTPNFFVYEHDIEMAGRFGNFFTCIMDLEDCPLCREGLKPSYCLVATVIDFSSYTSEKTGETFKNQKKLFVAKGITRPNLIRQIKNRDGDLAFWIYTISRGSQAKEPNTGTDFERVKKIPKEALLRYLLKEGTPEKDIENTLVPYDYSKVFAPKKASELKLVLGKEIPDVQSDSKLGELLDGKDFFAEAVPNLGDKNSQKESSTKEDLDINIDDLM